MSVAAVADIPAKGCHADGDVGHVSKKEMHVCLAGSVSADICHLQLFAYLYTVTYKLS